MTADVASARNNNLVAESDLDAALCAIQGRMAQAQEQLQQKHHENKVAGVSPAATQTTTSALLEQCSWSLQSNLKRVVQPIADDAFHLYAYQHAKLSGKDTAGTYRQAVEPGVEQEESHHLDDFTADELLDKQALRRVHELREQVREQTTKVGQIRADVLDSAVRLAKLQVGMWLGTARSVNIDSNVENQNTNVSDRLDDNNQSMNADKALVDDAVVDDDRLLQSMIQSLTSMMNALQQSQESVPEKVSILQDLINVVQESLNKRSGVVSLSQTERAIYSRGEAVISAYDSHAAIDPRDRLTAYLGSG